MRLLIFLRVLILLPVFFRLTAGYAQGADPEPRILSREQITALFNDSVRTVYKIKYPIFQAYKYADRSGQYVCALMESNDSIVKNDSGKYDTSNHFIRALDLKIDNGALTKAWELNDLTTRGVDGESTIWFWTSYISFKDYDGDGLIEPVIVYGTWGINNYDDGRVKIIIYYKGRKVAVRHQSSVLDGGRSTEYDAAYESLPKKLKEDVKVKMADMVKKRGIIL